MSLSLFLVGHFFWYQHKRVGRCWWSSPVSKLCIVRGKVDRLAKKMIFDREVQKKEEKIGVTSGHLFGHPKKLQAYRLKWAMSGMEASQFSAQTKTNICIALWQKTSQELRMLSRSLSDCRSLLLNLNLNLNRCLSSDCSDCSAIVVLL